MSLAVGVTLFVKYCCSKKQLLLFYHITEKNASFFIKKPSALSFFAFYPPLQKTSSVKILQIVTIIEIPCILCNYCVKYK